MRVRWFFGFFFVSGFCSLVYEVVWLRLAMTAFGVTTPLVSIVLSVFMAGLALGSWGAGRLAKRMSGGTAAAALRGYALTELVIGVSGLVVPVELNFGRTLLSRWAGEVAWASSAHYFASGVVVAAALLPFCTAMGATFPLAMEAIRARSASAISRSFSYLYLANVLGAAAGTLVSAIVMIELLGFHATLLVTASLNGALALGAALLGWKGVVPDPALSASSSPASEQTHPHEPMKGAPWFLFTTGLLSMAMEVVWVRQFSPYLGTVVYAFAAILAVYLGATFLGSMLYRRLARAHVERPQRHAILPLWSAAGALTLLPLALADPRLNFSPGFLIAIVRLLIGIGPVCLALGFLTPMLVDRWSGGDPRRAGSAYAANVLGCIVGPLVACFALLPVLGERGALVVLAFPLLAFAVPFASGAVSSKAVKRQTMVRAWAPLAAGGCLALVLALFTRDLETLFPRREVRRDATATVIATGEGMHKHLLVNGHGMTELTPITKMMAHLPLAFHRAPPRNALVICFGMGTSFRSAVSWGIPTTAVELIPSVPSLFSYFHTDAAATLAASGARIVIDDGRRYMERMPDRYDVITIDPPPPVEAAGSSLLYSREFLSVARSRLAPGGIVQSWFPGGERVVTCAIARALKETFPYTRAFRSHLDWGIHFLASTEPIPMTAPASLAATLPPRAAADMMEWDPGVAPVERFSQVLAREIPLDVLVGLVPGAPTMQDDRPVNEYFLLRRLTASFSRRAHSEGRSQLQTVVASRSFAE